MIGPLGPGALCEMDPEWNICRSWSSVCLPVCINLSGRSGSGPGGED